MPRFQLLLLVCASLLAVPRAPGQQPAVARLGVFFWHDSPNDAEALLGIKDGMRLANVACEFVERSAEADVQKGAAALQQLRQAGCRLVFAMGTQAALMAAASIRDVPVVFVAVANPVASGVVADWKGSGRNVAGVSYWIPPATVLKVFRMALPGVRRIGCLRSLPSGIVSAAEVQALREVVDRVDLEVVEAVARDEQDIGRAVDALRSASVQAIWIPNDLTIYKNLDRVRARLLGEPVAVPLVTTSLQAARTEAVVGATIDFALHGRRAAALGLRILRGADPATLPVDTMQSYLIVANLDAARRSRCELPLSLLALADELVAPPELHDGRR